MGRRRASVQRVAHGGRGKPAGGGPDGRRLHEGGQHAVFAPHEGEGEHEYGGRGVHNDGQPVVLPEQAANEGAQRAAQQVVAAQAPVLRAQQHDQPAQKQHAAPGHERHADQPGRVFGALARVFLPGQQAQFFGQFI